MWRPIYGYAATFAGHTRNTFTAMEVTVPGTTPLAIMQSRRVD